MYCTYMHTHTAVVDVTLLFHSRVTCTPDESSSVGKTQTRGHWKWHHLIGHIRVPIEEVYSPFHILHSTVIMTISSVVSEIIDVE